MAEVAPKETAHEMREAIMNLSDAVDRIQELQRTVYPVFDREDVEEIQRIKIELETAIYSSIITKRARAYRPIHSPEHV